MDGRAAQVQAEEGGEMVVGVELWELHLLL